MSQATHPRAERPEPGDEPGRAERSIRPGHPGEDAAYPIARPHRRRVSAHPALIDLNRAEAAAADFMAALGLPMDSEAMVDTPGRFTRAYAELFTVPTFEMTTFANEEAYDELVLVQDIPVRSVCEHHLLPFVGVAHVGYVPGSRILGLSKLARTVEFFARRPQTQERLTSEIAAHLEAHVAPRGVGVVIRAEHTCTTLRGARAAGTWTHTCVTRGLLRDDPARRAEFLALVRRGGD
jgi:GTP cyclohydrolase I